jgi:hypothetical protein
MPNWYIDKTATGTGSGDAPANAATDLRSFSAASSLNWGDYVWVRRTHFEASATAVASLGKTGFNVQCHGVIRWLGWPSSGDPFYELRPGDARSAGWDTDAATPYAGINYPSLVHSVAPTGNAGWSVLSGNNLYNFCLANSLFNGGMSAANYAHNALSLKYNMWHLHGWPGNQPVTSIIDMTYIGSIGFASADAFFSNGVANMKRLTMTLSCQIATGLFAMQAMCEVEEIVLTSNSVSALAHGGVQTVGYLSKHVGKIRGAGQFVNGKTATRDSGGSGRQNHFTVDDWFGEGPAMLETVGGISLSRATSAMAVYSGTPCMFSSVNSTGSNDDINRASGNLSHNLHHIRQLVQCLSGVSVKARFPFWAVVNSFENFEWQAFLPIAGGNGKPLNFANSGLLPGSSGFWSGNSLAAGSAYLAYAEWLPSESGSAWLTFRMGSIFTRSGYIATPPFFEVAS